MNRFCLVVWIVACLVSTSVWALQFPSSMSSDQVSQLSKLIGTNTASKVIGSPYAIGGHDGLELGMSLEWLDLNDIKNLGSGVEHHQDLRFSRIMIGKGLYYDVDVFWHFSPLSFGNNFKDFGVLLRWGFYHPDNGPWTVSLVFSSNSMNLNDVYFNNNLGADLVLGFNRYRWSVYAGLGVLKSFSRINPYLNGQAITASGMRERYDHGAFRTQLGAQYSFGEKMRYYTGIQFDQVSEFSAGVKLGTRF